jgi:5-methylcytosine-specific restriction endonuclease McrA
MRNLKYLPDNKGELSLDFYIKWYENIIEKKSNLSELKDLKDDISERYEEYLIKFNSELLILIPPSLYKKNFPPLLGCYKSEVSQLKELKRLIKENQPVELRGTCQYCGIGDPKTMDHYLPISFFPEYSVLALNLIPCCKDCNSKKDNHWKKDDYRGIINLYLDKLPKQQYLFGQVKWENRLPVVRFQIENRSKIDVNIFSVIENHFERLNLIDLYNDKSSALLDQIIEIFAYYSDDRDEKSITHRLLRDAVDKKLKFGPNYWESILKQTLAGDDKFLKYLCNIK